MTEAPPDISVVIPCYNEKATVQTLLKLVVEALSSDGRQRFRHSAETEVSQFADPEGSARDLGLSLGFAVKAAAGDAIGH